MARLVTYLLLFVTPTVLSAFVHPGLLHTESDFRRVQRKIADGAEPWTTAWNQLTSNSLAQADYSMRGPVSVVVRGAGTSDGAENYSLLFNDIAAAYQLGLRYRISGNTTFADAAIAIMDAWSSTLTRIGGTSDRFLASGIYGYEFANAAELLRDYEGWPAENFSRTQDMMSGIFFPMNYDFMQNHNGNPPYHYRANWDLCNMASAIAVGVLTDNQTMYDYAAGLYINATGTGNINHAIWKVYEEEGSGKHLGQSEESGRDQGHATLDYALWGAYGLMAYNQGDNIFAYNDSQILAGAEYTAKYSLGYDVPYTPLVNPDYNESTISNNSRGTVRPEWELLYAHYSSIKRLNASWTGGMRDYVLNQSTDGVEGGGGNYGPNSGGFDQLGFGTLMFRLE